VFATWSTAQLSGAYTLDPNGSGTRHDTTLAGAARALTLAAGARYHVFENLEIRGATGQAASSRKREISWPEFPDSCQKPAGRGIGDSGCAGRDGCLAMVTDRTRGTARMAANRVCRAARSDTVTFSEKNTSNLQIGGFELPGDGGETTPAAFRSADFGNVPCPVRPLPDLGRAPDADRRGGR